MRTRELGERIRQFFLPEEGVDVLLVDFGPILEIVGYEETSYAVQLGLGTMSFQLLGENVAGCYIVAILTAHLTEFELGIIFNLLGIILSPFVSGVKQGIDSSVMTVVAPGLEKALCVGMTSPFAVSTILADRTVVVVVAVVVMVGLVVVPE